MSEVLWQKTWDSSYSDRVTELFEKSRLSGCVIGILKIA